MRPTLSFASSFQTLQNQKSILLCIFLILESVMSNMIVEGHSSIATQLVLFSNNDQYEADLSSYENACRLDPRLQAFDIGIHERTRRALNKFSAGAGVQSITFDSLQEVTGVLLDMNHEVVKVIMEDSRDIWQNKDLRSLVDEYLDISKKTLDFCTALGDCLQKVLTSQLLIQIAVNKFEEELKSQDAIVGKKFPQTLEELQHFKAAGEPFTAEFFAIFNSIQKQQISMLEKLLLRKRDLDKRLKSVETWRRVSNVLFVTAFVSVLIFSVVVASVAAPPVVTAVAAAIEIPISMAGRWCSSLWSHFKNELRRERELLASMQIGTRIVISDLESIKALVSKIEVEIESLLQHADFAVKEEEHVMLVIGEIKKQLDMSMGTIESLKQHANKVIHDVVTARKEILQKIINYSGMADDNMLWNIELP